MGFGGYTTVGELCSLQYSIDYTDLRRLTVLLVECWSMLQGQCTLTSVHLVLENSFGLGEEVQSLLLAMELVPGLLAQMEVHFKLHYLIVCHGEEDDKDDEDRY